MFRLERVGAVLDLIQSFLSRMPTSAADVLSSLRTYLSPYPEKLLWSNPTQKPERCTSSFTGVIERLACPDGKGSRNVDPYWGSQLLVSYTWKCG